MVKSTEHSSRGKKLDSYHPRELVYGSELSASIEKTVQANRTQQKEPKVWKELTPKKDSSKME